MKYKDKLKAARKMRTPAEISSRTGVFDTKAWDIRNKAIASRVKRKHDGAHARAVERRKKAESEKLPF